MHLQETRAKKVKADQQDQLSRKSFFFQILLHKLQQSK